MYGLSSLVWTIMASRDVTRKAATGKLQIHQVGLGMGKALTYYFIGKVVGSL